MAAPSVVGIGGRVRHNSLISRSSKSWQVGMMDSIEGAQTTKTRSSRCKDNKKLFGKGGERRTHDECGELLPVSGRKVHHSVEDLNACVRIDIDATLIGGAGSRRMRGRYMR